MVWETNTSKSLTSTEADIQTDDFTETVYNQILLSYQNVATGDFTLLRYSGNVSGSAYPTRHARNGGADQTRTTDPGQIIDVSNFTNGFYVGNTFSIPGFEKLTFGWQVDQGFVGAGNTPNREEIAGKFVPSPDSDIVSGNVDTNNAGASYGTGSNLTFLGTD